MSKVSRGLGIAVAAALAVALSAPANATTAKSPIGAQTVKAGTSDATDFSSQRRRRYVRRGPNPGALAGAAAVGIIGSAIAAGAAREYYGPGPYYGPGYYAPPPPAYYGPGYYGRW